MLSSVFPISLSIFFFQNFLDNFNSHEGLMVACRVMLLIQLFSVFPLLTFILRKQLYLVFFNENTEVGYFFM